MGDILHILLNKLMGLITVALIMILLGFDKTDLIIMGSILGLLLIIIPIIIWWQTEKQKRKNQKDDDV